MIDKENNTPVAMLNWFFVSLDKYQYKSLDYVPLQTVNLFQAIWGIKAAICPDDLSVLSHIIIELNRILKT
eukprot:snap_masked-scaffold_17-processed-gene-0.39-mRNA-1 protein AED:1.00 eAED:1.00 QI:0/0/0/0/1/1/2/0/70